MKLHAYLRVSTDDKGQNPTRQADIIRPWAQTEAAELAGESRDEGKSATKTNPFERPVFLQACERAVAAGCAGLVVSEADRFCRQGWEDEGWAIVELRRRYGLRIYSAEHTVAMHDQFAGRIHRALKSELNHEIMVDHGRKVRTGMGTAKADGKHVGRPPKELTPAELEYARQLRAPPKNLGWGRVAIEINRRRGVHEIADEKVREKRRVSATSIRRQLLGQGRYARQNAGPAKTRKSKGGA